MSSRTPGKFTSSEAKDYIRHTIDRNIINEFKRKYYPDNPLAYLGLPGEQLLDILSWRQHLGRCTAVENTEAMDVLELNVLRTRLEGIVHPLQADINDLLSTSSGQSQLCWPYHLVNLDYCGGLIHAKQDRSSPRLDALKGLFARQEDVAFVLLLTVNLRDKDKGELDSFVRQQEEDLLGLDLEGVEPCFDDHRGLGHAGLLKIYVPIVLDSMARQHALTFRYPILYQGTKQMIHFAVECIPYREFGAGRVTSTQAQIKLINLPLLALHGSNHLMQIELASITV